MIAGFIILRLRNILGRRTGHEEKFIQISLKGHSKNQKQKPILDQMNKQENSTVKRKRNL